MWKRGVIVRVTRVLPRHRWMRHCQLRSSSDLTQVNASFKSERYSVIYTCTYTQYPIVTGLLRTFFESNLRENNCRKNLFGLEVIKILEPLKGNNVQFELIERQDSVIRDIIGAWAKQFEKCSAGEILGPPIPKQSLFFAFKNRTIQHRETRDALGASRFRDDESESSANFSGANYYRGRGDKCFLRAAFPRSGGI